MTIISERWQKLSDNEKLIYEEKAKLGNDTSYQNLSSKFQTSGDI